jgi:hypothetical protein
MGLWHIVNEIEEIIGEFFLEDDAHVDLIEVGGHKKVPAIASGMPTATTTAQVEPEVPAPVVEAATAPVDPEKVEVPHLTPIEG